MAPTKYFINRRIFMQTRTAGLLKFTIINGSYYMFATFKDTTITGGTAILKADHPLGPFTCRAINR
jgi:hypothetical protein